MRAWMKKDGRLQLTEAQQPVPRSDEVLVKVEAISLNRGEVRGAKLAAEGTIPGWDVAGTVVETGTRIAGMLRSGAWAEYAAVPLHASAVIPDDVPTSVAATLPLAGLTVMSALNVAGPLLGKRVLITGATGGVGTLATQLATIAGARVTGVREVRDVSGEFDVILESVGGESLANAIQLIAPRGVIITFGNSSEQPVTFQSRDLFRKDGATIYGLLVFDEVDHRRAGTRELAYLMELVCNGALKPVVEVERDWTELEATLADLEARKFQGKAVLKRT